MASILSAAASLFIVPAFRSKDAANFGVRMPVLDRGVLLGMSGRHRFSTTFCAEVFRMPNKDKQ